MAYERPEGVTEKEWSQFLADLERNDRCLYDLICPDCGNPLSKRVDSSQVDPALSPGTWFNYRCTNPVGCPFSVDQCEAH
jgi:hypothetical protein